jgi:hypothetical protein
VPKDGGTCECNLEAKEQSATTTCEVSNPFGTCSGSRSCGPDGLSPCDAAAPVAEECNGIDDDCDGIKDEDIPSDTCKVTNMYGTCTAPIWCQGGTWSPCAAPAPGPDLCDGLDNDCDGVPDRFCNLLLQGGMMGDGGLSGAEAGTWSMVQSVGTPRVVGSSSDGTYRLLARGPLGGEP